MAAAQEGAAGTADRCTKATAPPTWSSRRRSWSRPAGSAPAFAPAPAPLAAASSPAPPGRGPPLDGGQGAELRWHRRRRRGRLADQPPGDPQQPAIGPLEGGRRGLAPPPHRLPDLVHPPAHAAPRVAHPRRQREARLLQAHIGVELGHGESPAAQQRGRRECDAEGTRGGRHSSRGRASSGTTRRIGKVRTVPNLLLLGTVLRQRPMNTAPRRRMPRSTVMDTPAVAVVEAGSLSGRCVRLAIKRTGSRLARRG
jgi:hypothetical protein